MTGFGNFPAPQGDLPDTPPTMFGDEPGDKVTDLAPPSFMPDSDNPLPAHAGWDAMDGLGGAEQL